MGSTCEMKVKALRCGSMLYSGKMHHVYKETFQKPMHKLTLRSPFSMEELVAVRDYCAEVLHCKVHELLLPINRLTENMLKGLCQRFRLFGKSGMASRFFEVTATGVPRRVPFTSLLDGFSVLFGGYNVGGEHDGTPSKEKLEMYFRMYDWEEDGFLSHMDLFQGLQANNWQGRHYPPKVIQVITRFFQLLDEEGRGEIALHTWVDLVQIPEMVNIFFDYFEMVVHSRQCIEPIPLEPGMWSDTETTPDKQGKGRKDPEEADLRWVPRGISEDKEYLCPDGSPVTTVSVFDRIGNNVGNMMSSFIKENTDAGVLC